MKADAPTLIGDVLLLASNAEEVSLIKSASSDTRFTVVHASEAVMPVLRREGKFTGSPRPDLVLLDVDLSDRTDCAILQEIKLDPALRRIPVVILAPESAVDCVQRAYELRANACVLKPEHPEKLVRVIRATLMFWLNLARLPKD